MLKTSVTNDKHEGRLELPLTGMKFLMYTWNHAAERSAID